MSSEWLDNLKAGDMVAMNTSHGRRTVIIKKVERATKTLVFVDGQKYRRDTGRPIPRRTWDTRPCIEEPTPDLVAIATRERLVIKASDTSWSTLPVESLRKVLEIVEETSGVMENAKKDGK